jgi:glycosyltransferase involved in cell wall biosynthesis
MSKVCIISTVHNALDNRIFYREAYSLHKAGYEVTLIAVHDRPETLEGIRIIPLKRLKRSQRPLLWWRALSYAVATKAEIFHIHDPELLFISPFLRLFSGRPVVYDIHESVADFIEIKDDIPYLFKYFLSWTFRWLEPASAYLQSGLIFADDQISQSFSHVNRPKVTLYNYPLQSFIETATQSSKKYHSHQPIVLYLGGLKRNRGTTLMLDAFKIVVDKIPKAQLYLVGPFAPESLEFKMRSEIELRNLSNSVTITGPVPFTNVHDYLSQASIGWIPFPPVSKYQKNIPTKLFEYMAYAIPVVSSNLSPIHPFIEHRRTGFLVKADDPTAHARAIIELITDTSLSTSIGKNGQISVTEKYRWTEMEKRLISFYQQILSHYN